MENSDPSGWPIASVDAGDVVRRGVVVALIALAKSGAYLDRADAGRALASFADSSGAREVLVELLLDEADTFVTSTTAESLLRMQSAAALAPIAAALVDANFSHLTWDS